MSYDGGATPASIDKILSTPGMEWTEAELGLLGSLDKLGMTLSSILWGRVLQSVDAKAMLIVGLGLNAVSTFVFGNFQVKTIMFVAKFVMGVTQGLQCVWSTCWVLAHAPHDSRTVWMSLGAISAGIGNGIGTAVAGFGTSLGLPYAVAWQVEAAGLGLLWALMVFCPATALSIDNPDADAEDIYPEDKVLQNDSRESNGNGAAGGSTFATILRSRTHTFDEASEELCFHATCKSGSFGGAKEDNGLTTSISPATRQVKLTGDHYGELHVRRARVISHCATGAPVTMDGIQDQLGELLRNRLYIRTALALASVMFVTSGIQFLWVRLFMAAWGIGKGETVTGFLVSTGLGGAIGVVLGPQFIDKCGGFMTTAGRRSSLQFIVRLMLLSVAGAVVSIIDLAVKLNGVHWSDGMSLYLVWGSIFVIFAGFNGAIAGLVGINVASVSTSLRSLGSGCTVSVQNLLGYAMGPLLPGVVMDLIKNRFPEEADNPEWSAELLCFGLVAVLLGTLAAFGSSYSALRAARQPTDHMQPLLETV